MCRAQCPGDVGEWDYSVCSTRAGTVATSLAVTEDRSLCLPVDKPVPCNLKVIRLSPALLPELPGSLCDSKGACLPHRRFRQGAPNLWLSWLTPWDKCLPGLSPFSSEFPPRGPGPRDGVSPPTLITCVFFLQYLSCKGVLLPISRVSSLRTIPPGIFLMCFVGKANSHALLLCHLGTSSGVVCLAMKQWVSR